jgi:hypothetical protein
MHSHSAVILTEGGAVVTEITVTAVDPKHLPAATALLSRLVNATRTGLQLAAPAEAPVWPVQPETLGA